MIFYRTLLLLIFTISSFNLISQNYIGITGGYTDSWPGYGDTELPENAQTHIDGLNISLFYYHELNNNFSIGIHPGYIRRGAACLPGWEPFFLGDSKVFLDYFELPLMIRKSFDLANLGLKLNTALGYGISIMSKAYSQQELVNSSEPPIISPIEIHSEEPGSFNRMDHGLYFNLGLAINISKSFLCLIESTYYHGLKDYDKLNTSKNRSLNLNFGLGYYLFSE